MRFTALLFLGLGLAHCAKAVCDFSSPPTNGGVGDCTSTLADDTTCTFECNEGYTVSGPNTCVGGTAGTSATCQVVPCPSDSACTAPAAMCACTCNAGFGGTIQWTTSSNSYVGTCAENSCAAFDFPSSIVSGASDGCTSGIALTTQSDTSCTLACAAGWVTGTGTLTCSSTASAGDSPSNDLNCAAVPCPTGSTGSNVGSGCTCDPDKSGVITATSVAPNFFSGDCTPCTAQANCNSSKVTCSSDLPTKLACDKANDGFWLSGTNNDVVTAPPTMGLNFSDSLCPEFTNIAPEMRSGDFVPVCLVLSNETMSFKSVFYPSVDEFTLLEVDNSWSGDFDWWGATLGNALSGFKLHIEINGQRSELVQVQSGGVQVPYWTISAQLNNGALSSTAPFVWDNDGGDGCFGGCIDNECVSGFCGVPVANCGQAVDQTDCDLKVYLGWYGTDADGLYMTSAGKRLSAFRSWSLVEVFQSAAQTAQANTPDPDQLWNDITEFTGGIFQG